MTKLAGAWRWLKYRIVSALIHQPQLLRLLGALVRRWPIVEGNHAVVARHCAARHVFGRPESFSHTAHAKNLVDGDKFLIGLEAGPRHATERRFAQARLPQPADCGRAALDACRRHIRAIARSQPLRFDVVEDYMAWVAWAGMRRIFGSAAAGLESTPPASTGPLSPEATMRAFFAEMRYPGAHLLIGNTAPPRVQRRASDSYAALRQRVEVNLAALRKAWGGDSDEQVRCNAVGMLWVGHPATVQSGALVMQELLGRRALYEELRRQASGLQDAVWDHPGLRSQVRAHVLEALRFRPPFPILLRDVPRDTEYELDGERRVATAAGSTVLLLGGAAMFDPAAIGAAYTFQAARAAERDGAAEPYHLVFGHGPRACIAADHVTEILTSALLGLLTLPRLTWADRWIGRIRYDGPIITRMRLEAAR